jgi:predicted nucleotide-binding protein
MARFIEKLGCEAVILEERVTSGLTTIFEKLTQEANNISYAIVLLTPDDLAEDSTGNKIARVRQNVMLELGWFIGKLGAERVCLAKKGNLDIPSDIHGVLYLNLDDGVGI